MGEQALAIGNFLVRHLVGYHQIWHICPMDCRILFGIPDSSYVNSHQGGYDEAKGSEKDARWHGNSQLDRSWRTCRPQRACCRKQRLIRENQCRWH
jgi:hypothetical protein